MAVVPNTGDFGTGVATSTEANGKIRDPLLFLLNPPIARMRQTTLVSVPNNTFTAVTFQAEDWDKAPLGASGGHDNAVNNTRYTAQYPGYYEVSGGVAIAANATGQRGSRWAVNGVAINGSAVLLATVGAGNVTVTPARTVQVYLNASDYVELQAYQNSGGALDTFVSAEYSCSMDVRWVSN